MAEINDDFGPRRVTFVNFLFKVFAGLGAGLGGTILLLFIFFIASSSIRGTLQAGFEEIKPFVAFIFMAMIFLSSLTSNVLGCVFLGLIDRESYRRLSSSVAHIFALNIVIFILLAPLYLLIVTVSPKGFIFLGALQLLVSAQGSLLTLKVVSDKDYSLIGVYTSVISSLATILVAFLIFQATGRNETLLLLIALPLLWGVLGLLTGIFESISNLLFQVYGIDFLRADTPYGRDVSFQKESATETLSEEDKELLIEAKEDQRGADFLRKKKSNSQDGDQSR